MPIKNSRLKTLREELAKKLIRGHEPSVRVDRETSRVLIEELVERMRNKGYDVTPKYVRSVIDREYGGVSLFLAKLSRRDVIESGFSEREKKMLELYKKGPKKRKK